MLRLILSGCCGKMGRCVCDAAAKCDDIEIIAGIDAADNCETEFPVFDSFDELGLCGDVIVDFSSRTALPCLLRYISQTKIPTVIATTGFSENETRDIMLASDKTAIFFSSNMSLGITAVYNAVLMLSGALGEGFDSNIIEIHHREKKDAPSGTALLLSNAVNIGRVKPKNKERGSNSVNFGTVNIHSVRAGNTIGEHTVIFSGEDEIIEIKHTSYSKSVFAKGALDAARFIAKKKFGIYNMLDLAAEKM